MPPLTAQSRHRPAADPPVITSRWEWLTRLAFFSSLALVACRLMMSETIRSVGDVLPGSGATPAGPGPGTSLVLDLFFLLPALLVLLRRAIDSQHALRAAWSCLPFGLLALWAAASPLWSADKFAAVVSSAHLVAAAALLWAVAQVVDEWVRVRLVAAVCFGLLLVLIVAGYYYRFLELPDMKRTWIEQREQILREHHWKPDEFAAIQFGKRVTSGEIMGFSASPNTYAALLVLLGVVAAGAGAQRLADGDHPAWALAVAAGMGAALPLDVLTGCRAALATPILAAACFGAVALLRNRIYSGGKAAFWMAVGAVMLAAAAVVGHGLAHGTLFHASLTFRWRYWVGSARLFAEHPLIGVGWENFGPFYLAARLPIASEEIKDPHNFLVRIFVELGAVGGALGLAWMLRLWWEMSGAAKQTPAVQTIRPDGSRRFAAAGAIGGVAVGAVVLNTIIALDWSADGAFLFVEVARRVLFLAALAGGMALVALRTPARRREAGPTEDPRPDTRPARRAAGANAGSRELNFELDRRPAPWIVYGAVIGLGTFLVHNLIEFSIFEPGPLMLFALLAGTVVGARLPERRPHPRGTMAARVALIGGVAGWIAAAFAIVAPISSAEMSAREADDQIRLGHAGPAAAGLAQAFSRVPFNSEYAARAGRVLAASGAPPDRVREMLDRAVLADPASISNLLTRAAYEQSLPNPNLKPIADDYRRALALDPNNVRLRLDFAAFLKSSGDPKAAAAESEEALSFDSGLAPDEIKRLSKQEAEAIRRGIAAMKGEPAGAGH